MEEKTTINMAGIKETLLAAGAVDKGGNVINKETYFKVLETMERETNAAIENCYVEGVLKKSEKYTANMLYDKLEMITVLKKSSQLNITRALGYDNIGKDPSEKLEQFERGTQKVQKKAGFFEKLLLKMSRQQRS